jgi:hypothetical protein
MRNGRVVITKYIGPTNFHGSRISARAYGKRIIVTWDDALDVRDNHERAARELAKRQGWLDGAASLVVGGCSPDDSGYTFIFCFGKGE